MNTIKHKLLQALHCSKHAVLLALFLIMFIEPAHANIVDAFNLAPFVPLVFETMMNIATSLYKFFVGSGTGLIYIMIYALVGFYIALYLVKMYLPKDWLSFFGFNGGGEAWNGDQSATNIISNVLKPCFRAVVACLFLLQIKPVYMSHWLVNPFLEFGSIYTQNILQTITNVDADKLQAPQCPETITESGWLTKRSCDFLIQPVYTISKENNRVIKYGFDFLKSGLRGLITLFPHGGEDLMNIVSGILLIFAFVSSNVFMALLIIQGIFDFCLSLIMYPFNVLGWVAKKSDKWFDVLPAFDQIIDALKKLVITMIACAFILCVNIAIVRALFNWSSSVFVVAANGMASSNVPTVANSVMNFGQHSLIWISSILTFFLMQNIFKMTQERLDLYTKPVPRTLYNNVKKDAQTAWGMVKSTPKAIQNIIGLTDKATGKK